MSNIKHIPKGVLSFLALFVLISCFIGFIPVSAASYTRLPFFYYGAGAFPSASPANYHFLDSLDTSEFPMTGNYPFSLVFYFDNVPASSLIGNRYAKNIHFHVAEGSYGMSFTRFWAFDENGDLIPSSDIVFDYSISSDSYVWIRSVSSDDIIISTIVIPNSSYTDSSGHFHGLSYAESDLPFLTVRPDPPSPEPEPPTPATGEWQAFTQFIFGIFGTMGSIINNLLAAGGLSSIFFGFVFGIPIANFIIYMIEEIFDLEPYDPSSSWRREEHSLKELRPADYNNYAGDPPSNRIGF